MGDVPLSNFDEHTVHTGSEDYISPKDFGKVVELLYLRPHLHLSEKYKRDLLNSGAASHTFEHVFASWNTGHQDYSEDEEERVKDFDENHRLEVVWKQRTKWVNYSLSISFHFIVLINFLYCLWESLGILAENSKFNYLLLKDVYQCLKVTPEQDEITHFISIFHAITCIAVFHARTLQTANLCWAFLTGTGLHACFKVYEVLYEVRLPFDEPVRGFIYWKTIQLIVVLIIQIAAIIIILQRYYDLTARFQKRAHKFVTQTYEGRQLNDRIIYRNVSSFVQRKFVLRSCTALQIYNTVKKMQTYKKKLKKGEQINENIFNKDVRSAVQALKEVEGYKGMEMMRELKRKNYENQLEEQEGENYKGKFEGFEEVTADV